MTPSIQSYSMAPVSSTTQPQSMAPTNFPAYTSAPGGQLAQQQPFSMPYGHLTTTPSQMSGPQPNHLYYSNMNMQQQRSLSNQGQTYNNGQSQPPHPQAAMGLPQQTIPGQNTQKNASIPPGSSSMMPHSTTATVQGQAQLSHQPPQLAYTSMMTSQIRPSTIPTGHYPMPPVMSTHQIPSMHQAPSTHQVVPPPMHQAPSTHQAAPPPMRQAPPPTNPVAQPLKMQPIVPQPGSMPRPSYQTSVSYPSPAPSPFQPISPAPVSLDREIFPQRPESINLERKTSLDDMLDAVNVEMNETETPSTVEVLQPKVMTPGEIEEQKLEAQAKKDIAIASAKDPYNSDQVLSSLLQQMEDLETKSKDRVMFDAMWRELNVKIEADDTKKTISIARCYPMKNRSADVLPFDTNRVALPTTKVILS